MENLSGQIDYPKLRQTQTVELTAEKEAELEAALTEITAIVALDAPPEVEFMKICNSCSYAELCWG